jgi:molybdopterin/thiamine biosynthesis adenylyltransferase
MKRQFCVIGAGGTASHLIHALVNYVDAFPGGGVIHVWDADTVEPKNLTRQLFYPHEVNTLKAEAFAKRWPNMVVAHNDYVGADNIERAVKEDDTVFICADNMAVRRVINDHAKTLDSVTIVNGGNEEISGSVQYYERSDGKPLTPPLDFNSPEFDSANDEVDRSALSCAEIAELPGGEQTIVANQTVAALMMAALWRGDNSVYDRDKTWTKITFEHDTGLVQTSDVRMLKGALSE